MLTRQVILKKLRNVYDSLTCLALVVAVLVLAVIITSVTLHSAYIWLVMVAAAVMLLTACSYTTCASKSSQRLQETLSRHSVQSDDVSTLSEVTQSGYPNGVFSTTVDLPPSYDAVVSTQDSSEPPSYSTAIVLERQSSFNIRNDQEYNCMGNEYFECSNSLRSEHHSDSITYISETDTFGERTSISGDSCWSFTSESASNGSSFVEPPMTYEEFAAINGILLSPSYLSNITNEYSKNPA